jgi:hypothetical protein
LDIAYILTKNGPGGEEVEEGLTLVVVFLIDFELGVGSFDVVFDFVQVGDDFCAIGDYIFGLGGDVGVGFFDHHFIEFEGYSMGVWD